MSNYIETLQSNNEDLQEILETVNDLPDAASIPTEAVLYTEQILTATQKTQARENIGAMPNGLSSHNNEVIYHYADNCTIQVTNVQRCGRMCIFCLQFIVNTAISANYGFAFATLPFASTARVWINYETKFYMDAGSNKVNVNSSSLAAGNYMLNGFFFIHEN